jgi:hypothetical protein
MKGLPVCLKHGGRGLRRIAEMREKKHAAIERELKRRGRKASREPRGRIEGGGA